MCVDYATKHELSNLTARVNSLESLRKDNEKQFSNFDKQLQKFDQQICTLQIDLHNLEEEVKLKADFTTVARTQMDIEMHDARIRQADSSFLKHCLEVNGRFENLGVSISTKFHEV